MFHTLDIASIVDSPERGETRFSEVSHHFEGGKACSFVNDEQI